jgi:antibiotic biosynthesis monooxygenase (ABM) superfamily enzyme
MIVYHEDELEEWLDSPEGQVWLERFNKNDASYGWPWEIENV